MNSLLDRTFTVNAFSVFDAVALLISFPVLVISAVRYARVTRKETDLAFTIAMLGIVIAAALILIMDNIVPVGAPAQALQHAAALSLLLVRWMYLIGLFILAATVHFALRYTESQRLRGWRILWLYSGAISFAPLIWSPNFLLAPDHPHDDTSSWRVAVPWQPLPGELIWIYGVISLTAVGYIQLLIWRGRFMGRIRTAASVRSTTVLIGLTAISFSVIVTVIEGASEYVGIAIGALTMSIGMLIVGIGLGFEWELTEREREHVRRRFESYVDPLLVEYVIEHPEQTRFDGEVRELTVAFTDLEGYTPLAEKLRGQAVPLLNEYFSLLTPLIRECNGYRSKFLGDGIMFFYGAPEWNCDHAIQAVSTVLKMQETLAGFNEKLYERGMPPLLTRIGVSSGEMIVGDAGSNDASDYTVFGDMVNLGARLESANKFTGTRILISEGTQRLLPPNLFLTRPIGKLQVVGLSKPVMTYEPIAYLDHASETQRKLAELTQRMVESFILGDFAGCLTAERHLVEAFGPGKLAELYRERCECYLANPPGADFAGQIVLAAK